MEEVKDVVKSTPDKKRKTSTSLKERAVQRKSKKTKTLVPGTGEYKRQRSDYARFSGYAYGSKEERMRDIKKDYPAIKILPESSDDTLVLQDVDDAIIIASRGTVLTNVSDLSEDALIVLGYSQYGKRMKSLEKLSKKLDKKYPSSKKILTGHSLGGRVALDTAHSLNWEANVFNPGSGLGELSSPGRKKKDKVNSNIYRTSSDFVSLTESLRQTTYSTGDSLFTFKSKKSGSHGLENFYNL